MSLFDGPLTGVGPASPKNEPFTVIDDEGVVHIAQTYTRPIYAGYGDTREEDFEGTECLVELERTWVRKDDMVVTCLECVASR